MISYEKLEVYNLSLDCVEHCLHLLKGLPKGYAELNSQLKRAIFSVSLNIAEGAGKSTKADKRRFYDIARGSATESAAIWDILFRAQLLNQDNRQHLKHLLHRVISMLSKLSANLAANNTVDEKRSRRRPR
jgi:four helix bundle protein